jgi:hypothetical protein
MNYPESTNKAIANLLDQLEYEEKRITIHSLGSTPQVLNASIGADNRCGVPPQACMPSLRGVPGHDPRPTRRNALQSTPSFRRCNCTSQDRI